MFTKSGRQHMDCGSRRWQNLSMSLAQMARRLGLVTLATLLVWTPSAHAGSFPSTWPVSCSFTTRVPSMNTAKQISGSISITCTNKSRTTSQSVSIQLRLFEYQSNGVTFNYMNNAYIKGDVKVLSPAQKLSWTVSTDAKICSNVEVGKEDYGTEAVVSIVGFSGSPIAERPYKVDGYTC